MSGYRIAGPHRAQFARRLVAHGEDEIHHWGARPREFIPTFAAQPVRPQMKSFQHVEGQRMHGPFGKAAGAVASEPSPAPMIDQRLGQDAPRRSSPQLQRRQLRVPEAINDMVIDHPSRLHKSVANRRPYELEAALSQILAHRIRFFGGAWNVAHG
jgi:hypothetical protein